MGRTGSLIFGVCFLISSFTKIAHPYDFLYVVYDYQLLPGRMNEWLAFYLPWLELFLAYALLFDFLRPTGMLVCSSLLAIFVIAQGLVLSRGTPTACGCFNSLTESISSYDFARTVALFVLSIPVTCALMSSRRVAK